MKIFNWVHRKFNNKEFIVHAAENAKKHGDNAAADEHFPAENKCDDVFEGWRGGILAIGTFGYENQEIKSDYFFDEADSVKDEDGDDEPLVLVACEFNEGEIAETEENEEQFGFEYVMMKKKERTTLADLFVVDSGKDDRAIGGNPKFEKPDLVGEKSSRKCAPSPAGKLTAKDGHRPIQKLNKVMRRMMRRKIHPDVGPINPKVAALNDYNSKSRVVDDCAALLPTQE
ncbi:protein TILLER ANGLE CONTROL 1-like isoform X1 [Salvia splendens]|uniref:protein TILLER ANGLE CONTROL 1-like isoform X1 n=1 Tax=Salvia splendens TaxID=180675 RepID=UPI001C2735C6|nr:protein TILLER ANGLE CONTROL 1-like isoform X1 [Salvia splendens]